MITLKAAENIAHRSGLGVRIEGDRLALLRPDGSVAGRTMIDSDMVTEHSVSLICFAEKRAGGAPLDDPRDVDQSLWVCWVWNGEGWPAARRTISYLTETKVHVLKGFALFTTGYKIAKTFPTKEAASAWVAENEKWRGQPYTNLHVTTFAELRRIVGYPDPRKF